MISLTKLRTLDLVEAEHGGLPQHLSAASGLTRVNSRLYVVADNELHLGVFPLTGNAPGHLIRLFEGELPMQKADRKRAKPDLEAITLLPAFGAHPFGALLALGSGSKVNRRNGVLLDLDARGAVSGVPRPIDFSPLLIGLDQRFPALNIEGALISDGELRLLQRGNRRHPDNAIIRFPLATVLDAIESDASIKAIPSRIDVVDLGRLEGVPLTFTDGAALPNGGIVFSAVAEDTEDSYNDGACLAAAIGVTDRDGNLEFLDRLDHPHKVEGVAASLHGASIDLLLVTDADDASIPASLFAARIPHAAG